MTTATAPPSSSVTDPVERRARVREDLARFAGLEELLLELELYADLEAELDRCRPPLHVSPLPSRARRRELGIVFDVREVRRVLEFCRGLRHVKGRWGGTSLVPDLWQVLYVLAPVFGIRQADGRRYYRELFLEVPRKNGKSTLSAALTLFLLMADSNLAAGQKFEPGAEVYTAATTKEQALAVFEPAKQMAARSAYAEKLSIGAEALIVEATLSKFVVLSGDPAKAEEKMGSNVSGAVIDETHVHKDRALIDTIETGTAGREQPLVVHLTTAGKDTDGTIYAEKHDYALALAAGDVGDSRTWAVVYTIPKELEEFWDDPETWAIANPGLGVSVSIEYLEDLVEKCKRSEPKRLSFCRLHLNVRSDTVSRWIELEAFDASGAFLTPTMPELRHLVAYGGLDLSSSNDLTALAMLVPRWQPDPADPAFELEVLEVILRVWTPLGRIDRRPPRERELFRKWLDEPAPIGGGTVLLGCEGETVDYDEVELEAGRLAEHLEVERLSFDRWGSKQMIQHLSAGGLNVVELGQGFAGISPAMKETERIILDRRLRHGGNPLLRYAFGNLAVELDTAGNIKPNRKRSSGHVDPAVAVVMAVDSYARDTYGVSVYEERGLSTA